MKKIISIFMALFILTVMTTSYAYAQSSNELNLGLSKTNGYNDFGNNIQGIFTLKIKNPPNDIVRVVFYYDTNYMGEVTSQPFNFQFTTDSYPLGLHTLNAVGYTNDGRELNSNSIQANFISASAARQGLIKIVGPILGLIALVIVISVALPLLLMRGKMSNLPLGTQRNYGIGGGAICPKCGRPFPLRLFWLHIGFSKIDRCPYCGKWSLVRTSSLSELRAAEAAELSQAQPGSTIAGETDAEKLKRELDDSRYQNS